MGLEGRIGDVYGNQNEVAIVCTSHRGLPDVPEDVTASFHC